MKLTSFSFRLLLVALVFNALPSFGVNPWVKHHFTTEDGLNSDFITCISQDKFGDLIIGTTKGINIYNGKSFITLGASNGLAEGSVSAVFSDEQNSSYVGHFNGGVTLIRNKQIDILKPSNNKGKVLMFTQNNEGIIFGLYQNGNLFKIEENRFSEITESGTDTRYLFYHNNKTFGVNQKGIFPIENGSLPGIKYNFPEELHNCEFRYKNGQLFAWNQTQVFKCLLDFSKSNNLEISEFSYPGAYLLTIGKNSISLLNNHDFNLLRTSAGNVPDTLTFGRADLDLPVCMFSDREDNVWIGSASGGLYKFIGGNVEELNIEARNFVRIERVYQNGDSLWIASNNGLKLLNANSGKLINNWFSGSLVNQVTGANNNQIIVSVKGKGVFRINENGNAESITFTDGLKYNSVLGLREGNLAAYGDKGVYILNDQGETLGSFSVNNDLSTNDITSIYEDKKGRIWVGGSSGNINYIYEGKVAHLESTFIRTGTKITGFAESMDGHLWIATLGDGLVHYDFQNFHHFNTNNSDILGDYIQAIACVRDHVWISTKKGVNVFDESKDHMQIFDARYDLDLNGLVESGLYYSGEHIWLSSAGNLYRFLPQNNMNADFNPAVTLDYLMVSGVYYPADSALNFDPGIYDLTYELTAHTLSYPEKLRYSFRLKGLQEQWSQPSANPKISFQGLIEGKYKLEARAIDHFGNILELKRNPVFSITPPFYKKWWFILLCTVVPAIMVIVLVRFREHQIRMENIKLQGLVDQRTAELKTKNESLKNANIMLEDQNETIRRARETLLKRNQELDRFAYIVSHDLKAPLRGIHALAGFIEEDISAQLSEEDQHNIKLMKERVSMMNDLIEAILTYSRATRPNHENANEIFSSDGEINEIVLLFEEQNAKITVHQGLPELKGEKVKFNQVMLNLISNAIKHNDKENNEVDISFKEAKGGYFEFVVRDNGPGIKESDYEKVFDIFTTLNHMKRDSTGIGLSIVKKIIEDNFGHVWINSVENEFTEFRFTWPGKTCKIQRA